jgi:hypothetical protein
VQEVKLAPNQRNGRASPRYLAPRRVNRHVTQRDRFIRPGTPGLRPTQVRPHARHQLARFKRLRHVAVRAQFQTQDDVRHVVARRQHHDRHLGLPTDLATDIPSGHSWEHQVKDDQGRVLTPERLQRRGPVARHNHSEAIPRQVRTHDIDDPRFVIDD